jgi:glycosyltransferase involved in cell wall biosynthesis
MKVAVLTTDSREHFKEYGRTIPYFGTAPEALLQGFAMLPEVEVHVISCARARMQSPETLAPNIFFHSLYVPKIGWMKTMYQGCIQVTRRLLRQLRPDIVHGQGTERDCAISAIFSGFPNVLTIHGNMRLIAQVNRASPFSFWWLAARLERFTIPRSQGIVCITRYTQQAVAPLARKTWVVPNAVDASFFEIEARPPTSTPPIILCVGSVCLRKNQNAFIRALDGLTKKMPFKVVFLGGASPGLPYDDEFLGLVQARSWCEHAGFADRDTLKKYLREASLLVLPSIEDNCPMVVLEAMAAGVPVIAPKVGGVPDLVEDGITGLFVNPHSPESMRAAVESALTNPRAARERAERAKVQALARFHPKVIAEGHLQVYREALHTV